ncbi:redoxin domain-containing protein [Janibacter indicus]|uniref:redoxin domain-containing protein n=1 Tax=Janibacter indicus TaxID=857417 RepID=UPI003D9A285D
MSLINTQIKPFQATGYINGEFKDFSEADIAGKWAIFFFYPADFTFVCPTELEDLAAEYDAELKGLGVEVFSVSTDTHFTHKAWHETSDAVGKVTYPMLGDPTATISRNFDILREDEGLANRGTFLVDPDGVIQFLRSRPRASAATPRSSSARSRPPSTSATTLVRSARPSGKRAPRPSPRAWTSSARSDRASPLDLIAVTHGASLVGAARPVAPTHTPQPSSPFVLQESLAPWPSIQTSPPSSRPTSTTSASRSSSSRASTRAPSPVSSTSCSSRSRA